MRYTGPLLLTCTCGLLLVRAIAAAETVSTPGFSVTIDVQGWVRLDYRGLQVVTGEMFEVAKREWRGKVFPPPSRGGRVYRLTQRRDGDTVVLEGRAAATGAATNTLTITLSADRATIANRFLIEPRDDVGFVYTDLFFSRSLLDGAQCVDDTGHAETLRAGEWHEFASDGFRWVRMESEFGTLRVEVESELLVDGRRQATPWNLRSVCDRTWGPDERRTFTLMHLYPVEGRHRIEGRTAYTLTLTPSARFDAWLQSRRQEQEAQQRRSMERLRRLMEERQKRIETNHGIVLLPQPQELEVRQDAFAISSRSRIVVPRGAAGMALRPAEALSEELRSYFHRQVDIVGDGRGVRFGDLFIGYVGCDSTSSVQVRRRGIIVTADSPGPEGYVIDVAPAGVMVMGSDLAGAWFGVQTLVQLIRRERDRVVIPCCRIRDWPEFRTRAMMLTLGAREQMPFLRTTLRRVLPRAHFNMVFIGGASLGRVRWPSHPEFAYENAFTTDDIRELADLARANFIEPVPHVQGFGHTGPLHATHPELLAPLPAARQPCFDITRPTVRDFIFDLYADAIDAFRPQRFFHVGFDEAHGLDVIAGGRKHSDVVAEHITAVSQWLERRHLKMVMWADMLLDHQTFSASSAANSRNPGYGNVDTAPALEQIPTSIVLANWYYGGAANHPSLVYLRDHGFEVFPTTWFLPANNYNFIRSAHRAGLRWVAGSSWMYCSATNPGMMSLLAGEYGWTPEKPPLEQLDYTPTEVLAQWLKPPRVSDGACTQSPVDISSVANRSYVDDAPGDGVGWLDMGAEHDLRALTADWRTGGRYAFKLLAPKPGYGCVLARGPRTRLDNAPQQVTIPLALRADALVFLHTAGIESYAPTVLGAYTMRYADGSHEQIELRNAINIGPWRRVPYDRWFGRPRLSGYYIGSERAWVGYTLAGEEVDLVATEWRNPHPGRVIDSITLEVTNTRPEAAVALFALTALQGAK